METQVAIVGAGPVGLGLAIELGTRGVEVVIIERTREVHDIPKGQNLTQRSMEHFKCWGVEPEIRRARLMPDDYPSVGVNAYGSLLSEYAHPWFRRSAVDEFYFAASERLPQYLTEQVLRRGVSGLESVTALYGASVSELGVPLDVLRDDVYPEPILVRPDHYIAWVGDGAETDIGHIVRTAAGWTWTPGEPDLRADKVARSRRDHT